MARGPIVFSWNLTDVLFLDLPLFCDSRSFTELALVGSGFEGAVALNNTISSYSEPRY